MDLTKLPGCKCTVNELNVQGVIVAASVDMRGVMYRVNYWFDGDRRDVWLYPWEVTII